MIGVVQSNGNEIAYLAHAWAEPRFAWNERQFLDRLLADLGKTFGRQRIPGEVWDDRGQVADAPFGIQNSGLFTAARAEADKLHCSALSGLAGELITETWGSN
jgi:hypothetical protein